MVRWVLFLILLGLSFPAEGSDVFGPRTADEADEDEEEVEVVLTAEDIPASIVDTEVGDWASYVMADGSTLRLTVAERWSQYGDDHLIIRNETGKKGRAKKRRDRDPGVTEDLVSVKERVADVRDLGPDDYVTATTLLVDRRRIDAVIVNYVENGEVVRQSYFSGDVPVFGLVRGVRLEGGKRTVVINLKSFGQAGEDED